MFKFLKQEVEGPVALKTIGISFFIFAMLILMLSGCAIEKKQLQKAQNKVIQSGTLSELCAKFFPPNLAYKAGDTVVKYEYQYLPGQVITRIKNDTMQIERVDTVYRIKTQLVHDTLTVESTAKLDAVTQDWKGSMTALNDLSNQLLTEKGESAKYKSQRNTAYLSLSGLGALILLYIFLRIKSII